MRLTLNRNLQANAFYSIALFFLSKIQKGNKSDLNRRFKRRLSPGLKPAIFSRFPAIFPQNEYFTTVFFGTIIYMFSSRHVANTLSPFWAQFCWKKHCFVLARKHLANTKQGFFQQNWP